MNYARNMNQTATYFAPDGQDGFGDPRFAEPVQIACRWQDKNDLIRDTQGRQVVSSAVVYLAQDINVAGRLALGAVTEPGDARDVMQKAISPSLSGDTELVKAWL